MIKSELVKARCTPAEKEYLQKIQQDNNYRSLSEVIREVINSHMINNAIEQRNGGRIEFK